MVLAAYDATLVVVLFALLHAAVETAWSLMWLRVRSLEPSFPLAMPAFPGFLPDLAGSNWDKAVAAVWFVVRESAFGTLRVAATIAWLAVAREVVVVGVVGAALVTVHLATFY
ncbi:unnamed protein product, partial [Durusdinium trenchii]